MNTLGRTANLTSAGGEADSSPPHAPREHPQVSRKFQRASLTAAQRPVFLLGLLAALLTGCDPTIHCWYTHGHQQALGEPWFELRGRTSRFSLEVDGPYFINAEKARQYIVENKLKMCGGEP